MRKLFVIGIDRDRGARLQRDIGIDHLRRRTHRRCLAEGAANDEPHAFIAILDQRQRVRLVMHKTRRALFEGGGQGLNRLQKRLHAFELIAVQPEALIPPSGTWEYYPGTIEVPENVGNFAWGGAGWRTLFLAASTSLFRVQTTAASTRLPYHR